MKELTCDNNNCKIILSYHAARADLLRRTNQREAAADAYDRALALCGNSAERAYLQRRLHEMLNLSLAG